MKAMLMTAVNQPFSSQAIADPQPGPGQVRIRLHATGVCGTDIHVWRGEFCLCRYRLFWAMNRWEPSTPSGRGWDQ